MVFFSYPVSAFPAAIDVFPRGGYFRGNSPASAFWPAMMDDLFVVDTAKARPTEENGARVSSDGSFLAAVDVSDFDPSNVKVSADAKSRMLTVEADLEKDGIRRYVKKSFFVPDCADLDKMAATFDGTTGKLRVAAPASAAFLEYKKNMEEERRALQERKEEKSAAAQRQVKVNFEKTAGEEYDENRREAARRHVQATVKAAQNKAEETSRSVPINVSQTSYHNKDTSSNKAAEKQEATPTERQEEVAQFRAEVDVAGFDPEDEVRAESTESESKVRVVCERCEVAADGSVSRRSLIRELPVDSARYDLSTARVSKVKDNVVAVTIEAKKKMEEAEKMDVTWTPVVVSLEE